MPRSTASLQFVPHNLFADQLFWRVMSSDAGDQLSFLCPAQFLARTNDPL
jgi:hypothetical protein